MKSSQVALFIFTGLVLNCLEEVCGSPAGIQDIQITPTGRCADAGITSGCCVPERDSADGETEHCRVYTSVDTSCYCDVRCHEFGDCCSDINEIQCHDPTMTCQGNDLHPGCCTSNCYVSEGVCFCDSSCHYNEDCCIDVPATSQCSSSSARVSTVKAFNANQMRRGQQRNRLPYEVRTSQFSNNRVNMQYRARSPISRRQGQMSARPRQQAPRE